MYIEGHTETTTYYTPSTDTVCSQLNLLPSAEQLDKADPPLTPPMHLHGNTQPREGKLVPWKQELENKRIAESVLTSHLKGNL